jgi:hypothetical protein
MSFVKVTSPAVAVDCAPTPADATTPRRPATDPHTQRENLGDARRVAFIEHTPALTRG